MPPLWLHSRPSLVSPRECDDVALALILLEDSRTPADLCALCERVGAV